MTKVPSTDSEIQRLSKEVAEIKKNQDVILNALAANGNFPIPGKRCTIHTNCSGGGEYCNDGGPVTDFGIGW